MGAAYFGVGAVRGGFRQGHLQTARPAALLIRGQRFIRRSVQNASAGNTIGKTLAFGSVACDVRFDDSSSSFCIWSDRPRNNRRQAARIRSNVMRALRNSANPSVPIGPVWLQEAERDITSLGSTIVLGLITFAVVGYLFLARKSAVAWLMVGAVLGGGRAEHPPQVRVRTPSSRFRNREGLYHELSQRTCHIIGHYLSDNRRPF